MNKTQKNQPEQSRYPFVTISKKIAVYLKHVGNIDVSKTDNKKTPRNPNGFTRFIYNDRTFVLELMKKYHQDNEFHRFYDSLCKVKEAAFVNNKAI